MMRESAVVHTIKREKGIKTGRRKKYVCHSLDTALAWARPGNSSAFENKKREGSAPNSI